jgi:serine/threonine protein phosphatase 1
MTYGKRYVIGDIHGCLKSFQALVRDKIKLHQEDTLFLVGDYIDRGPDSRGVLDYIMELQKESYMIRPIMGNHEYMLLLSLEDEEEFEHWQKNGSKQTLMSFGIPEEKVGDIESIYDIPEVYIDYLSGLKYFEETEDFYFVHAGLAKGINTPTEDMHTLLWTRKETYNRTILKGRNLVHGHTPVPLISIQDRVFGGESKILNLDGGCVYPHMKGFGYLVGMNLDTFELYYQKNIE